MAAKDAGTTRRRRYGWNQPKWRDTAFWTAVGITVVLVVAQSLLITDRGSVLWFANIALRGLFTWILISSVIRIRVGIRRGLAGGFRESQEKAAAAPGGSRADNFAKSSGRTVGRAIAAYKKSQSKPPS